MERSKGLTKILMERIIEQLDIIMIFLDDRILLVIMMVVLKIL